MQQRQLILASSSPYRREVLARLGVPFDAIAPDIDEQPGDDESPSELVQRLSLAKARAVAERHPHALVLGGDQVLACAGRILGKPHTAAAAAEQLAFLSGKSGRFHTGLAALGEGYSKVIEAVTEVRWRQLTDDQIASYIEREPAFDCAGSAKLEGLGICLVESIDSPEPTALLGVPLIEVCSILREVQMLP
ncbi:MAG: Maf family protein [Betaproteobacteria bacterium]|nr:Maf family protein [Betaproteobacteria bacterium]